MQEKHSVSSIIGSRRSLRLLYGGVSILVLTVVLTAFLMLTKLREEAEAHAAHHARNMVMSLNLTFKGFVDAIDVVLALSADEISQQVSAKSPDRQAIEEMLALLKEQKNLGYLAYVRASDAKGKLIYGPGVPKPFVSLADRNYFIQLKKNPNAGLFISKPIISRVNDRWIWLFARRINKRDGSFGGVVYAPIFVDDIKRIFSQIKMGHGNSIELHDAKLRLVSRYISPDTFHFPNDDHGHSAFLDDALSANALKGSYRSSGAKIDGVERKHFYLRNDVYGFTINVGVAREVILAAWQKEAWGVAGLVAIFIALSLSFAALMRLAWLRQEHAVASLEASREALQEAQKIAHVGHYSYNFLSDKWESSDALNDIYGIDSGYPRDLESWLTLIISESRQEAREHLNTAVKQRASFDHEYRIKRVNDGQERWVHDTGELHFDKDGNVTALFGAVQDISKIKEHEEALQRIANYDELTGVPNRRLMADRLNQAVVRAERSGNLMAVCYVDLDNFKPINDLYGHAVGDKVLINVTERLKRELRVEDTVARLGGDEFVLIFADLANYEEIHTVLDRLLEAVRMPVQIEDKPILLTASIGVTLFPSDKVDADTLLRHADQAMYRAKEAGKDRYHLFDYEHDRRVQAHRYYQQRIKGALVNDEFFLVYQPKVDLVSGEVVGVEALIRWQHPDRGLLLPCDFLHYINGNELEIVVGEWVIDTVLTQIEIWNASGLLLPVSVNIGARHLLQPNFSERLGLALARYPSVAPSSLELEVLETAAISDIKLAANTLTQCRLFGVLISLDDFGTGYSSLTYFRQLPVQILKIDQSFVRDMLDDPNDLGIVESVVWMAQMFNRKVIAEGVESLEHGAMLVHLGCHLAQGYGIARPMPAAQIDDWVVQWYQAEVWRSLAGLLINRENVTLQVAGRSFFGWIEKVVEYLDAPEGELQFDLESHRCPFGSWYQSSGAARYGELSAFHEVGAQHEKAHELVKELVAMAKSGNAEAARQRLPELEALRERAHKLIDALAGRGDV